MRCASLLLLSVLTGTVIPIGGSDDYTEIPCDYIDEGTQLSFTDNNFRILTTGECHAKVAIEDLPEFTLISVQAEQAGRHQCVGAATVSFRSPKYESVYHADLCTDSGEFREFHILWQLGSKGDMKIDVSWSNPHSILINAKEVDQPSLLSGDNKATVNVWLPPPGLTDGEVELDGGRPQTLVLNVPAKHVANFHMTEVSKEAEKCTVMVDDDAEAEVKDNRMITATEYILFDCDLKKEKDQRNFMFAYKLNITSVNSPPSVSPTRLSLTSTTVHSSVTARTTTKIPSPSSTGETIVGGYTGKTAMSRTSPNRPPTAANSGTTTQQNPLLPVVPTTIPHRKTTGLTAKSADADPAEAANERKTVMIAVVVSIVGAAVVAAVTTAVVCTRKRCSSVEKASGPDVQLYVDPTMANCTKHTETPRDENCYIDIDAAMNPVPQGHMTNGRSEHASFDKTLSLTSSATEQPGDCYYSLADVCQHDTKAKPASNYANLTNLQDDHCYDQLTKSPTTPTEDEADANAGMYYSLADAPDTNLPQSVEEPSGNPNNEYHILEKAPLHEVTEESHDDNVYQLADDDVTYHPLEGP